MSGTRAAIRYAKAILDIAHDKAVATKVNNDMATIATTINSNAELSTFIGNPTTRVEVKNSAFEKFSAMYTQPQKGFSNCCMKTKGLKSFLPLPQNTTNCSR
jgi:F-type H+-transporting ATPase subunit delta